MSRAPEWIAVCVVVASIGCSGRAADDSHEQLQAVRDQGRELFFGRAGCIECHSIGTEGGKVRGPNLGVGDGFDQPVAVRAASDRPGSTPIEYIVQSILDPDAFVVPTYAKGVMKRPDEPPISLSDTEIVAIAAFLADAENDADLAVAREKIASIRQNRGESASDAVRLPACAAGDPARGKVVFEEMQCIACHGDREKAPSLQDIGKRLSHDDLARWIVAPPPSKMPDYSESIADQQLCDLCAYLLHP